MLREHLDRRAVNFVVQGFIHGFDLGFKGDFTVLNTRPRNLLSARSVPTKVNEAIQKELERGHTSGPFRYPPFNNTHCSPLGSAPKPDGSVRLILDLSSPRGDAVNEGINQDEFSCTYTRFDDAVSLLRTRGRGAWMAKADIQHAFRLCPVRPDLWWLLCYQWGGSFYVDTRLPFGARSSPYNFNCFAILLAWVLRNSGKIRWLLHYLDDFFFLNDSFDDCHRDLIAFQAVCDFLGVPLAQPKVEGPSQCLIFLGIELDSVAMSARLPEKKLVKLRDLINKWKGVRKATKRELLSLIGFISFACKVVRPGRMFLRRLIDLSTSVTSLNFFVTLNREARQDIMWWDQFLTQWHGVELIPPPPVTSEDLQFYTDASGVGLGAVFGERWFSLPWPPAWLSFHINVRELFAIWAAVHTWGDRLRDTQIEIYTDSLSMTQVWITGSCKDKDVMHIIRALFFFTASRNINLLMRHIPGLTNTQADALSRLQVPMFRMLNPHAQSEQDTVADDVWEVMRQGEDGTH